MGRGEGVRTPKGRGEGAWGAGEQGEGEGHSALNTPVVSWGTCRGGVRGGEGEGVRRQDGGGVGAGRQGGDERPEEHGQQEGKVLSARKDTICADWNGSFSGRWQIAPAGENSL